MALLTPALIGVSLFFKTSGIRAGVKGAGVKKGPAEKGPAEKGPIKYPIVLQLKFMPLFCNYNDIYLSLFAFESRENYV